MGLREDTHNFGEQQRTSDSGLGCHFDASRDDFFSPQIKRKDGHAQESPIHSTG